MTTTIELFGRGDQARLVVAHAVVDDADLSLVSGYRWTVCKDGYAIRRAGGRYIYMHRVVLGLEKGCKLVADHINRDKLDNRRCNLCAVTIAANTQNRGAAKRNTTGYRGVMQVASGRYRATAAVNGRVARLGLFDTAHEAAEAARAWRAANQPWNVEPLGLGRETAA
ncbi:HNH endonuclease [Caballeronia sp. LZ035]|uniref:HNH endonuclease n=1 Tax=Caballeronia sp. LZ035 TaxID=3038568 RepID=UPI00285CCB9A|nr:HNH endonuclease [Caballeronia sp. LZ035]MDR5761945.1 HNH endonuclease [Caballeronia sp. LZ035]